jgi:F0F1-type ATP synthase epsilon subunit
MSLRRRRKWARSECAPAEILMNTFKFEIITPDMAYPPRDVVSVNVPAENGPLTVLARHQAMLCCLRNGRVTIVTPDSREETWTIGQGTLTVRREMVTMLVQDARKSAA